jgi:FkbM family methyltransferase
MKNFKNYLRYPTYYFLKVLAAIGILKKLNVKVSKNVYGFDVSIPVLGKTGLYNLIDGEPWLFKLFSKIYSIKQGAVIDVGINIGQTLLKFKSIDKNIDYYGFEPNPTCIYYVHQLIINNDFKNVKIFPVGLSDSKKMLTLYADNEIASGASILESFRENYKANFKYSIPVWEFDEVDLPKERVSIVKIDVEGYELEVIKGMIGFLENTKPIVICEILPVYNLEKVNGKYRYERQQELLFILRQIGYEILLIDEADMKLNLINEIPVHGDMGRTNYVLCHKDDLPKMEKLKF